jgi:DNA-binding transcriptional LysR family regulator
MNMTMAADKLYMTQSAVSQAIKELEQYYQCECFERLYHKLYITEAGKTIYDYANRVISLCTELEDELKKPVDQNIRIGVNFTVGETMIYDFINEFKTGHTNAEVILYVNRASALKEMLKANQIDFALMEENSDKDLFEEIFFKRDQILFVSAKDCELQAKQPLTPEDICKEKLLLREKGAGVRDLFDQNMIRLGLKVEPYWESNSTSALINAVHNNMGISVLPYELIKQQLGEGFIKRLKVKDMQFNRNLMITYSKNKYITPSMKDFFHIVLKLVKNY